MSTRRFVTLVIHQWYILIFQTVASAGGFGITSATNVSRSLGSRNRCTVILIPKYLGKIKADQAKGILVVAAWATQYCVYSLKWAVFCSQREFPSLSPSLALVF